MFLSFSIFIFHLISCAQIFALFGLTNNTTSLLFTLRACVRPQVICSSEGSDQSRV